MPLCKSLIRRSALQVQSVEFETGCPSPKLGVREAPLGQKMFKIDLESQGSSYTVADQDSTGYFASSIVLHAILCAFLYENDFPFDQRKGILMIGMPSNGAGFQVRLIDGVWTFAENAL